jgi:hypothetical protein
VIIIVSFKLPAALFFKNTLSTLILIVISHVTISSMAQLYYFSIFFLIPCKLQICSWKQILYWKLTFIDWQLLNGLILIWTGRTSGLWWSMMKNTCLPLDWSLLHNNIMHPLHTSFSSNSHSLSSLSLFLTHFSLFYILQGYFIVPNDLKIL